MSADGLDGLLLIDKEQGPTSHDVVARLRRILAQRRLGHCGTLDPLATGLMVLCVGRFTRLNPWLSQCDKEYVAELHLGAESTTGDAEGTIEARPLPAVPDEAAVAACLRRFLGPMEQVPPAHSAIKIGGVRSHVLARAGKAVDRPARRVRIDRLDLMRFDYPYLQVRVRCSKGTYIRALAADIGRALGGGAYLRALRRTAVGAMQVQQAMTLEQVRQWVERGQVERCWLDPRQALGALGQVELDEGARRRFCRGQRAAVSRVERARPECAVYDDAGRLCGIGRLAGDALQPVVVLQPAPPAAKRA